MIEHLQQAVSIYLALGACAFLLLCACGIEGETRASWKARGKEITPVAYVMAIAWVILAWPKLLYTILAGMLHQGARR